MLCLDWSVDLRELICVDLSWFVGKNGVVWIKGKMIWLEWIWVESLWKFVYDVIDKI